MTLLLVDGYNIAHAWPQIRAVLRRGPLADARDLLIARLAEYAAVSGVRVSVVFDGPRTAEQPPPERIDGIEVRFSGHSGSADALIERLTLEATRRGEMVRVATSDRLQRDMVRAMGAATVGARELEGEVDAAIGEMHRHRRGAEDGARLAHRVEHRLSPSVAADLEQIRRGPAGAAPVAGGEGEARPDGTQAERSATSRADVVRAAATQRAAAARERRRWIDVDVSGSGWDVPPGLSGAGPPPSAPDGGAGRTARRT